jgi:hypothetical protein
MEIDLLDVAPLDVLGALAAVDEDQHAAVPLTEIPGAIEL